jgi:hypothetical protein
LEVEKAEQGVMKDLVSKPTELVVSQIIPSEVHTMATEITANGALSKARGHAQLVFVVAIPAALRAASHLIGALRHADNVSGALNATLIAMLVASMIVGHLRFMRWLKDQAIEGPHTLDRLADAESSVAGCGFLGVLVALGFPFSIG